MLGNQRLRVCHFRGHLLQLFEGLGELGPCRWVLGTGSDQLNSVQSCLFVQVVQELDNLIKFVKVVDLNFAFLELSERGKSSDSTGSHLKDLIRQHDAKRRD